MYEVMIPQRRNLFNDATSWCKENKIVIRYWSLLIKEDRSGRKEFFRFEFDDLDDAAIFKLRWL